MRGKGFPANSEKRASGITPAYAGKSVFNTKSITNNWDHPRVCGEKILEKLDEIYHAGSPPRMRGKVYGCLCLLFSIGITPAYAGKSQVGQACRVLCEDHPRVCGEKGKKLLDSHVPLGSPPRMRGKDANVALLNPAMGITPAYAGKSIRKAAKAANQRDHPRVCGEKMHQSTPTVAALGSPPRMRGKDPSHLTRRITHGITPAYAGKSQRTSAGPELHWGSPPRMRGKEKMHRAGKL